jgi:phosphatidate cytidylyltransferase
LVVCRRLPGVDLVLLTRIITALVALPLAIAAILFLPTPLMAALVLALMLCGAWEWGALMRLGLPGRLILMASVFLLSILVALWRHSEVGPGSESVLIGLAALLWLTAILWIARFPRDWAGTLGQSAVAGPVGAILLAAPVASVAYLHQSDDGPLLVLVLCFLVWAADTGAYAAGRTLGRHKLAPNVSPGKTVEGAIGGALAALLVAGIAAFALDYTVSRTLGMMALGVWVAIISIVGDLTISMFKRSAGLKDSGKLFPGHGGVLDRLDSLIAAAPWFVLGLHWLPAQT